MILADFAHAMERKDYVAMSKCFADSSRLFDYCPAGLGKENFHIYGSLAIEMFYHNQFFLGGLAVYDAQIDSERTTNFYISYGGTILHATATIEAYDAKTGLIREMVIRPA